MSDFTFRRRRRPSGCRIARWSNLAPIARDQVKEDRRMNPQLCEVDIRADLVLRVRQEIAEGVYDTPERLQTALDRLTDRLECD